MSIKFDIGVYHQVQSWVETYDNQIRQGGCRLSSRTVEVRVEIRRRGWIGLGSRYTRQSSQGGEDGYHRGQKIRSVKYKRQSNSMRRDRYLELRYTWQSSRGGEDW